MRSFFSNERSKRPLVFT